MRPLRTIGLMALMIALIIPAAPAQAGYATLRPGDSGASVQQLQQALRAQGHSLSADGKYGQVTEAAVLRFQQQQGIRQDGIAGSQTLSRLYGMNQAPQGESQTPQVQPTAVSGRLEVGSQGDQVRNLQQKLKDMGYDPGRVDGQFDAGTRRAVVAFQAAQGLQQDGIAGSQTLARLYGGGAQPPASVPAPQPPLATSTAMNTTAVVINSATLRMRSSPDSSKNNVVAVLKSGDKVQVSGQQGEWSQVSWYKYRGFVMSKYLKFASPPPAVEPEPAPAPGESSAPGDDTALPPLTAATFTRILRAGDSGSEVWALQARLVQLGYALKETGNYDQQTQAAVRGFQQASGLKVDGSFGPQSAAALLKAAIQPPATGEVAPPASLSTLRMGNQDGADKAVSAMQQRLKQLGYSLAVDGSFGTGTHDALVQFQQSNSLSPSGVADVATLTALYGNGAKGPQAAGGVDLSAGRVGGPSASSVQMLDWYSQVKPQLRGGLTTTVYHPASGVSFSIQFYSLGRHADAEPKTLKDTQLMNGAFGRTSWDVRPVYVKLPSGGWTLATMHNYPHLSGSIQNNGFGGHLCIHFKRDLEETQKLDPNYGMQNQRIIRKAWQSMTGEVVN